MQSGENLSGGTRIRGSSADSPLLVRSLSASQASRPSSSLKTCVLARIYRSGGSRFTEYQHQPLNVEKIVYPTIPRFQTQTYPGGTLRLIESDEELLTVSYKSNGEIVGILDHDGIFQGVYNMAGARVKLFKRKILGRLTLQSTSISPAERKELPDGVLCEVRRAGPSSIGGPATTRPSATERLSARTSTRT